MSPVPVGCLVAESHVAALNEIPTVPELTRTGTMYTTVAVGAPREVTNVTKAGAEPNVAAVTGIPTVVGVVGAPPT